MIHDKGPFSSSVNKQYYLSYNNNSINRNKNASWRNRRRLNEITVEKEKRRE